MSIFNILLIAFSLSFDAVAVAMANGAKHIKMPLAKALKIAFFFGLFQFLMPIIGWFIGVNLLALISGIDHWVAFLLLAGIGVKMLFESFKPVEERQIDIHGWNILILLSIATSVDALAIGITFAILPVNIWLAVTLIGLVTFIMSILAIYIGKRCGEIWGKKSEIVGGLILIAIGFKILLSHILIN
ncbi:MAG: manganese efflux pump MntP family protein [Patescibacteria group bacterium]